MFNQGSHQSTSGTKYFMDTQCIVCVLCIHSMHPLDKTVCVPQMTDTIWHDKNYRKNPLDKTVTQTDTCTTDDRHYLTWSELPQEPPGHDV